MRDATKIKLLAHGAKLVIQEDKQTMLERDHEVIRTLDEISAIAERMDARTGTIDPSARD